MPTNETWNTINLESKGSLVMKFGPVYVIVQKKNFYQKNLLKMCPEN